MILVWFLILLTVIVFVHELGHYIVARINGVRVEIFSIGFGRELFGINDNLGTRWKICLIPLGGYVKFFGDANLASNLPKEQINKLSKEDLQKTFHNKTLKQKAFIVFAGPLANFLFTIVIFFGLYSLKGVPSEVILLPVIDKVLEDSAAYKAGFKKNDKIISADNKMIDNFREVKDIILSKTDQKINFLIQRGEEKIIIIAKPDIVETIDSNGMKITTGRMGFTVKYITMYESIGVKNSIIKALKDTYLFTLKTFQGISQIITGKRSASELGGPIMIASVAANAADKGLESYLFIMAIISINLGLINLFPIPLLDGGHLLLYGVQAVTKTEINDIVLKYYYGIGMFILLALMIFVNYNDLIKQLN
jgi:regulator of sigma E protease